MLRTETTQTHEADEESRVLLPRGSSVPPEKRVCFIKKLPSKLLSHVFNIAVWDGNDPSDIEIFLWLDLERYLAAKRLGEEDSRDTAFEITREGHVTDEDEDVSEDEGEDEDGREVGEEDGDVEDEEEYEVEEDDDLTDEDEYDWPVPTQSFGTSSPRFPIQAVVPRVCHHWRSVAFSTPSLWTTIVVSPQAGLSYERESKLLERSKNLPIDINIDFEHCKGRNGTGAPSVTELQHLFTLFSHHTHRWRTMKVTASEYTQIHLFLRAISNSPVPASQLKTLELRLSAPTYMLEGLLDSATLFVLFGGSAPLLTELILRGVPVDWDQPWIASASNLTDLWMEGHPRRVRPSWAQFATILRGAPALQKLELRIFGPSDDSSEWFIASNHVASNALIELSRLTSLRFACDTPLYAIGFFHRLSLPAIKSLSLSCVFGNYTSLLRNLAEPAVISSTPSGEQPGSLLSRLQTLTLSALSCSVDCVATVYTELQNLSSLHLWMSYLPRQFLDILGTRCTVAGRSDVWLPRLETLYVSGVSGGVLRKVIERRGARASLSSLTVYVEASIEVDEKDEEWLKTNLKAFDIFMGGFST